MTGPLSDEDDEPSHPRPSQTKCLRCGYRITWAEQRRQFGRAMKRGLSKDEAKALMPRCQVCLTAAFRGELSP